MKGPALYGVLRLGLGPTLRACFRHGGLRVRRHMRLHRAERGIDMSKYRSARAVLAGAAVIALAGCGASASTSGAASGSTPAGSTPSSGSPSVPASAGSTSGTPSATSNSFVSAGSIPFPIAVGNTWVYQVVSGNRQSLVTNRVLSVAPVPSGHRVTMSETISGAATQTTQKTYIFYANGKIGYPVNEPNGVSVLDSGGV